MCGVHCCCNVNQTLIKLLFREPYNGLEGLTRDAPRATDVRSQTWDLSQLITVRNEPRLRPSCPTRRSVQRTLLNDLLV